MAAPAAAADEPWSLELGAGVRYDSNINVEQADIVTGEDDFAAVFEASAEYELKGPAGSLEVGYDFGQRLYEEFDQFDLQTHAFSADAKTRLGKLRLGLGYGYHVIRLGDDPFLNLHIVTPSVAAFVAKGVYLRGYYTFYDKDFEVADGRDADSHSAGLSAFRFFMDSKAYVNVAARYDIEDTVDPVFDYDGFQAETTLQLPLDNDGRVRFGYGYRERNYDNVTPSIGEKREERRSVLHSEIEVPLIGGLGLEAEYRYTDRNSNFPATDYNEHLVTAMLRYRF